LIKSSGSSGDRGKAQPIGKGEHELGWELTGDVTQSELSFKVGNPFGGQAMVYYTRENLDGLRKRLSKTGKPKEISLCD
jgi:hypothetical protein